MDSRRVARNYARFRVGSRDVDRVPFHPYGRTTVQLLRRIGKAKGLQLYKGLRKRQIECAVWMQQKAILIQRWVRRVVLPYHRAKETVRRIVRLRPRNAEDPITLDPLPSKERVFKFVRPDCRVAGFDAVKLAEYVVTSGSFEDPVTRHPFHPVDLWRLDRQVRGLGYQRLSTLSLWKRPDLVRAMRERESLVAGMERITGDVVEMMIDLSRYPTEDARALLRTEYYPQFLFNYLQLYSVDAYAAECGLADYRQRIDDEIKRAADDDDAAAGVRRAEFLALVKKGFASNALAMRVMGLGTIY